MRKSLRSGFLLLCTIGMATANDGVAADQALDQAQRFLTVPSETVVAVTATTRLADKPQATTVSDYFLEQRLARVFSGEVRAALAGSQVDLWLEVSTGFHTPDFPKEVWPRVNLTGCRSRFEGYYVVVFDKQWPLRSDRLIQAVLQQQPPADGIIPVPQQLKLQGRDVVGFYATQSARTRTIGGRETAEDGPKIDLAWSEQFWMASPEENVLLIATSKESLNELLKNGRNRNQGPSLNALTEWTRVSADAGVRAVRHFPDEPHPGDLSDPRRYGRVSLSGIAFDADKDAQSATIRFLDCDAAAERSMRGMITTYVDPQAEFARDDDTLTATIRWADLSAAETTKKLGNLVFWLEVHLGHAVVI